jgi:hypothetical protein
VVEWTGPPAEHGGDLESEDSGPASVVDAVQDGAQQTGESPGAEAPELGLGFISIAAFGGLGLSVLALVVALLALIRLRRA